MVKDKGDDIMYVYIPKTMLMFEIRHEQNQPNNRLRIVAQGRRFIYGNQLRVIHDDGSYSCPLYRISLLLDDYNITNDNSNRNNMRFKDYKGNNFYILIHSTFDIEDNTLYLHGQCSHLGDFLCGNLAYVPMEMARDIIDFFKGYGDSYNTTSLHLNTPYQYGLYYGNLRAQEIESCFVTHHDRIDLNDRGGLYASLS